MAAPLHDPLPFHWYAFFGILEPISVLAGSYYATFLPTKYYFELIPDPFLLSLKDASTPDHLEGISDNARMALGQLGSCYFLIMLNSALMFFAIRKFIRVSDPLATERVLRYLFVVLGVADWTHILLTLYLLPNGPPHGGLLTSHQPATVLDKLKLLLVPSNWNALLFGNIMITLILFLFRALWWAGVARGSPITALKKAKRGVQKAAKTT
ncbi:hypothetical protein IE53DRAFT_337431 [Violaceomyces palustris]|uniref:Uncharacterized protein n=1 Tax=Violaceomyces palustris TaxID=1673888 RepID=A0ACD0P890_9BASI|nr:hypothetical protein IE53DRAFT_337431 [Violaceomyces palustris]